MFLWLARAEPLLVALTDSLHLQDMWDRMRESGTLTKVAVHFVRSVRSGLAWVPGKERPVDQAPRGRRQDSRRAFPDEVTTVAPFTYDLTGRRRLSLEEASRALGIALP